MIRHVFLDLPDQVAARGFLAAMVADPADPTPRLVLADWLDDRGAAAPAVLLRVRGYYDISPASPVGRRRWWRLGWNPWGGDACVVLDDRASLPPVHGRGGCRVRRPWLVHWYGGWRCVACGCREPADQDAQGGGRDDQ